MKSSMHLSARQRPTVFFKYTPASTAIAVLAASQLRWSSPLLFNDPFDVPRELSRSINIKDLHEAIRSRVRDLLTDASPTADALHPGIAQLLNQARASSDPRAAIAAVQAALEEDWPGTLGSSSLEALQSMWRSMLPELRLLCLTESPRHAAMWYHYADEYTGAVLAFECIPALDSAWFGAQPVNYPRGTPPLYSAEGWASLLTTRTAESSRQLLDLALFTKSPDWSYENEWRIAAAKRPSDTGLFSDFRFAREELIGVYLGPLIKKSERDRLVALAGTYPRAALHQVSIGVGHELEIASAV
jgi:hypothetical protein